jgi:hypothetical protein
MSVRYIFNTDGDYVAFVSQSSLFTPDCDYLGFIINGNEVFSKDGLAVGILLNDDRIVRDVTAVYRQSVLPPFPPFRPFKPFSPFKRLRMPDLPYPYKDVFENGKPDFIDNSEFIDPNKFDYLIGALIVANDGQFLGLISLNKYDQNSISNIYGEYGSKYSATSIFNRYNNYGSIYSYLSPFNQYTNTPPQIMSQNQFVAYLTINKYLSPKIDTNEFLNWFLKKAMLPNY